MRDPRRLLGGDASDFERELLRSWDAEQPSAAARAKVLAAMGIGAGAATAAAVKVGAAAAGGSLAPKAAAATLGGFAAAKWAALAVGVAVVGATAGYVRHEAHVHETRSVMSAPASVAAPPPPSIAPSIPLATAETAPVETPVAAPVVAVAEDAPRARVVEARAKAVPAPHPSALGEQVSALDSARRALAAGDAPAAVGALDDYAVRFPDGALVEEAEALRVQALLAAGDRAAATRAGDRFLAAHPNSPHAARVRALLASP